MYPLCNPYLYLHTNSSKTFRKENKYLRFKGYNDLADGNKSFIRSGRFKAGHCSVSQRTVECQFRTACYQFLGCITNDIYYLPKCHLIVFIVGLSFNPYAFVSLRAIDLFFVSLFSFARVSNPNTTKTIKQCSLKRIESVERDKHSIQINPLLTNESKITEIIK